MESKSENPGNDSGNDVYETMLDDCPKCGCSEIGEIASGHYADGYTWCDAYCLDCHYQWREWYLGDGAPF